MTRHAATPPVARIEPKTIEQLGRTRIDDYAWMKDDNWQQVMRDPCVLRADIRAYLDEENAYREAHDGFDGGAAGAHLSGNARAHEGRRFHRAGAGWAVGILPPLRNRRAASDLCAHARAAAKAPEHILLDVTRRRRARRSTRCLGASIRRTIRLLRLRGR